MMVLSAGSIAPQLELLWVSCGDFRKIKTLGGPAVEWIYRVDDPPYASGRSNLIINDFAYMESFFYARNFNPKIQPRTLNENCHNYQKFYVVRASQSGAGFRMCPSPTCLMQK